MSERLLPGIFLSTQETDFFNSMSSGLDLKLSLRLMEDLDTNEPFDLCVFASLSSVSVLCNIASMRVAWTLYGSLGILCSFEVGAYCCCCVHEAESTD